MAHAQSSCPEKREETGAADAGPKARLRDRQKAVSAALLRHLRILRLGSGSAPDGDRLISGEQEEEAHQPLGGEELEKTPATRTTTTRRMLGWLSAAGDEDEEDRLKAAPWYQPGLSRCDKNRNA